MVNRIGLVTFGCVLVVAEFIELIAMQDPWGCQGDAFVTHPSWARAFLHE